MNTVLAGVVTSPVNMENRQELGIKAGDTVRVHQKIQDKGKTRIQIFEGLVLARKHGNEPGATFTVRKVASGVGVEKIFPLYSPAIDKIEIVKRAKVRRAKLYYIREKVARQVKRQMRRMHLVSLATESGVEVAAREEAEAKEAEAAAAKAEEERVAAEAKAAEEAEAAVAAEVTAASDTPEETADAVSEAATPSTDDTEEVKEEVAEVAETEAAETTDESVEETEEEKKS